MWYPYKDPPMADHSNGPEPQGDPTQHPDFYRKGYWKLARQQTELIEEFKRLKQRIKELEQENERLRSAPSGTPPKRR